MPLLILLVVALLLFGAGFTLHFVWWIAVVVLIAAILSYFFRGPHSRL